MASILDRYGIKEVADVTFYTINDDGTRGAPALYLDTLKVSTIEQTAETADARGGKGNPKLITWDYGKEITVTIEDALFSAKSMAIMFGNGSVINEKKDITKTAVVRLDDAGKFPDYFVADVYDSASGGSMRAKVYVRNAKNPNNADCVSYEKSGLTITGVGNEEGTNFTKNPNVDTLWESVDESKAGQKVFLTYTVSANTKTITISSDSFPGTYYVTGDTYARSDVSGKDQFFQFIIQKAKVTSENTITLEAEGDPSVFNMNLTVLRPESGEMMQLVQYDLVNPQAAAAVSD